MFRVFFFTSLYNAAGESLILVDGRYKVLMSPQHVSHYCINKYATLMKVIQQTMKFYAVLDIAEIITNF